ncbi:MAG: hypothetical protein GX846_01295 [Deltaproteobacteria bacterium]|nr:hypothetical protein [Deltaproteobacteria bacterium]
MGDYVVCTYKGTLRRAPTEKSINETSNIMPEQVRHAAQTGIMTIRTGMVESASQWN